jgi:hypothetical protein
MPGHGHPVIEPSGQNTAMPEAEPSVSALEPTQTIILIRNMNAVGVPPESGCKRASRQVRGVVLSTQMRRHDLP